MKTVNGISELIFQIIYFVILTSAFVFGAVKLFGKSSPMYFRLYVMACGCLMLESLISGVLLICRLDDGNITAAFFFGTFSFSLFILSANRGTLDGIVDERGERKNRRARIYAFAAPVIIASLAAAAALGIGKSSPVQGILLFAAISPTVFASYYNLKHLLLPVDDIGFLKATRGCNIAALAYEISDTVFIMLSAAFPNSPAVMIYGAAVYAAAALLVIAAVRGYEKWEI